MVKLDKLKLLEAADHLNLSIRMFEDAMGGEDEIADDWEDFTEFHSSVSYAFHIANRKVIRLGLREPYVRKNASLENFPFRGHGKGATIK